MIRTIADISLTIFVWYVMFKQLCKVVVSGEAESEVVGFWLRYVGDYNEWPEFAVYWNGVKRGVIRRWHTGCEWVAFGRGEADALHLGTFQTCIEAFRKHVE